MVVFYKIFYVTALNYFLGALNCSWLVTSNVHYNVDFPNQSRLGKGTARGGMLHMPPVGVDSWSLTLVHGDRLAQSPTLITRHADSRMFCFLAAVPLLAARLADCMVMPHMVLMLVAAVAAVLAIAVSGLMSLAEVTPNPASQNWLAAAHSAVEVKTWAFKTAIVISANILVGNQQVQSILLLIAAGWIAYVHLRYVSVCVLLVILMLPKRLPHG